jgi:hypothetical protein
MIQLGLWAVAQSQTVVACLPSFLLGFTLQVATPIVVASFSLPLGSL